MHTLAGGALLLAYPQHRSHGQVLSHEDLESLVFLHSMT
jgi:hypothetical protein